MGLRLLAQLRRDLGLDPQRQPQVQGQHQPPPEATVRSPHPQIINEQRYDVMPSQSIISKALHNLPNLVEKEFDTWLTFVNDALLGAGMSAMFRISGVPADYLADQQDVREVSSYPRWLIHTAWQAIRRSIATEPVAIARTASVRSGDVVAFLRSLRSFYERRSVSQLTQLRRDLNKINISDYPTLKHYVAGLDSIFTRLSSLGDVVADDVKRFYLIEGLSDEYQT